MDERRQYIRINDALKISYQVLKSFRRLSSDSIDISGGGIRLSVYQKLMPGIDLDLEIFLEQRQRPIIATAEVIWTKEQKSIRFPFTVGLKFLEIKPTDRKKIVNYVKKKSESDSFGLLK